MSKRSIKAARAVVYVLAPLALLASLMTWAVSSSLGSSADEDFHLSSIWCGTGLREALCEPGSTDSHRRVPRQLVDAQACFNSVPNQAASCPVAPTAVLANTDRGNFDGIYPPVFYFVMGLFAGEDISASVVGMRVFNATLYVGIMTALFLLISPRRRGLMVWASLATLVPFGVFYIPSVNPSSWAIISASSAWLAVLGYFEAEARGRRWGLAALAVASALIGAGARADAAAYIVVSVALVIVLKAKRTREFMRLAIFPIALAGVSVVSFLSSRQSDAVNPGVVIINAPSGLSWSALVWNNLIRLPELWGGAFGAPLAGRALWINATAPGLIWVPMLLAFGGLVFLGLRKLDFRKAIALSAVVGLLVILPMLWLMRDQILVGVGVQPRYLHPLIIIFAGLSLLGFHGANAGLRRIHLVMIASAVFVANAVTQWITIRRYITGLDVYGINLDHGIEWWWGLPIGPMPLWILGSVAFAAVCALCVLFGWRASGLETPRASLPAVQSPVA